MRAAVVGLLVFIAMIWAVPGSRVSAQQPRSVFLEELTSEELGAAIAGGYDRILLFSGGVEQTGPHLAIGKHQIRGRRYAEQIARSLGRTLVAPIVPFVPNSSQFMRNPGTINVRPEIFAELNAEIARSLAISGFKFIILLGDHGANQEPLRSVAPQLDAELKPKGTRVFFSGDLYAKSTKEIEAYAQARNIEAGGHGGVWDTSELWAVDPSAVRVDKFAAPETPGKGLDKRGISGDPRRASPELGKIFGEIRVRNAVAEINELLASP